MRVTYDPAKRERTLTERGLDFEDAVQVWSAIHIDIPDLRFEYGESRFQTVESSADEW